MQRVAIIGGGPAGLMAAEVLSAVNGKKVDIFDAMPSVGRKFLMAGKGGMNITHAEPFDDFLARYGDRAGRLAPVLRAFGPEQVRDWIHGLGIETFIGTSGRVFPADMKAAPLLRAWLHRLRERGVSFHVRHRWVGWEGGRLCFETPAGRHTCEADAVILGLGGGSWAKLGSDGVWVTLLAECGVPVAPLLPANCGFDVAWTEHFKGRFAGSPVKSVLASDGQREKMGEFIISETGIEGSLIYAFAARLRDCLLQTGSATLTLDLAPGRSRQRLVEALSRPRGRDSLANHLRRHAGIEGVKAGLLRECGAPALLETPERLADAIKALPIRLTATRPIDEAISTAGGVRFEAVDARLMLSAIPGVFVAGEMLDWEAPTGGYLLTACLSSGRWAGLGVADWLAQRS